MMARAKYDLLPDTMLEIALRAMTRMGHEYSTEWTDTWMPPWWAHEYIYTTAIGRALKTAVPGCVFYEYGIRELVENERKENTPIQTNEPFKLGRVDITVFRSSDVRPVFCIEVKKNALTNNKLVRDDVNRCKKILKASAGGTLREAAVVLIFRCGKGKNPENLKQAFNKQGAEEEWGGNDVVGLDEHGKLTSSYNELDIQKYDYNGSCPHNKWDRGEMGETGNWTALAIRIR